MDADASAGSPQALLIEVAAQLKPVGAKLRHPSADVSNLSTVQF